MSKVLSKPDKPVNGYQANSSSKILNDAACNLTDQKTFPGKSPISAMAGAYLKDEAHSLNMERLAKI